MNPPLSLNIIILLSPFVLFFIILLYHPYYTLSTFFLSLFCQIASGIIFFCLLAFHIQPVVHPSHHHPYHIARTSFFIKLMTGVMLVLTALLLISLPFHCPVVVHKREKKEEKYVDRLLISSVLFCMCAIQIRPTFQDKIRWHFPSLYNNILVSYHHHHCSCLTTHCLKKQKASLFSVKSWRKRECEMIVCVIGLVVVISLFQVVDVVVLITATTTQRFSLLLNFVLVFDDDDVCCCV